MSDSEQVIADAWNECITPNLEALTRFFQQDEWVKMVEKYYRAALERLNANLLKTMRTPETTREEAFLRGEIAAMHSFIMMPSVIKRNIEIAAQNKKTADDRNPVSGY